MLYKSLLCSETFWKLVECLDCLKEDVSIEYLLEESGSTKDLFYETLTFFNEYGQHFVMRSTDDGHFVRPGSNHLNLNLIDYMLGQGTGAYTVVSNSESETEMNLRVLANAFKKIEKLRRFKSLDKKMLKTKAALVIDLEEAIIKKKVLKIKKMSVLPRFCYWDDGLYLLGEKCKSSTLVSINLEENISISLDKNNKYKTKLSIADIRRTIDFIYETKYYA